jgi:hypothetical protein
MANNISPFDLIYRQAKTIFKKYFIEEVALPLLLGVSVAVGFSFVIPNRESIPSRVLFEPGVLLLVTLGTYLYLTYRRLRTISLHTVYHFPEQFRFSQLVDASTEFLCTSVIPPVLKDFSTWFKSEIIEEFSFVVRNRINNASYLACRVLIFMDDGQPSVLKAHGFFDGCFARRVAQIHKNSGVDIGFLSFREFSEVCQDLVQSVELNYTELDMVMIHKAGQCEVLAAEKVEPEGLVTPMTRVTYKSVSNAQLKQKYIDAMSLLKNRIYDASNLKPTYDFYKFLFT